MAIKKWNDDNSIFGRLERLEKIFDDFFGEDALFPVAPAMQTNWAPRVDIKESKKNFTVLAEFPGLTKDDIDVSIEDNVLTIKGEKKVEDKEEGENYIHVERSYGTFFRSFRLPDNVDAQKVEASFKNGLLKLVIPKKKGEKGKKIEIKEEK